MGAILRLVHRIRLRLERIFVVRPGRFAEFGAGTRIRPPLMIHGGHRIKIGKGVVIGTGLEIWMYDKDWDESFDPHLTIGDGTKFGDDLFITCASEVTIGRNVLGADRVTIVDNFHEFEPLDQMTKHQAISDPKPVHIGDGSFLGIGCVITHGVTLGERAFVGANSVVTKDVEAGTMVVGNPARPIKRFDGERWVPLDARS